MWKNERTYFPVTGNISQWTSNNWLSFFNQDVCWERHHHLLWYLFTNARHVWIEERFMTTLETILTKYEFHMMQIFINVILNIKIGNKAGPSIHTTIGICQGDCLSILLLLLYLSHALKSSPSQIETIDYGKLLRFILDWIISGDENKKNIEPQYADVISFLRSNE